MCFQLWVFSCLTSLRIHGAMLHGEVGILPSFPWILVASGLQAMAGVLKGVRLRKVVTAWTEPALWHQARLIRGFNHPWSIIQALTWLLAPMHIWTKTMTCKNPAGRPGCAQPPRYVAGAENPGTRRWSDRCKAQSWHTWIHGCETLNPNNRG